MSASPSSRSQEPDGRQQRKTPRIWSKSDGLQPQLRSRVPEVVQTGTWNAGIRRSPAVASSRSSTATICFVTPVERDYRAGEDVVTKACSVIVPSRSELGAAPAPPTQLLAARASRRRRGRRCPVARRRVSRAARTSRLVRWGEAVVHWRPVRPWIAALILGLHVGAASARVLPGSGSVCTGLSRSLPKMLGRWPWRRSAGRGAQVRVGERHTAALLAQPGAGEYA